MQKIATDVSTHSLFPFIDCIWGRLMHWNFDDCKEKKRTIQSRLTSTGLYKEAAVSPSNSTTPASEDGRPHSSPPSTSQLPTINSANHPPIPQTDFNTHNNEVSAGVGKSLTPACEGAESELPQKTSSNVRDHNNLQQPQGAEVDSVISRLVAIFRH